MPNPVLLVTVLLFAALGAPAISWADSGPAGDAHAATVAALAAGDVDAIEASLADDGTIVFSLGDRRAHMGLHEWLGHFRGMIESGTRLSMVDREVSGGGNDETAWIFAIQDLTWTPEGAAEPASTAVWYTTEVWEHDGDRWKVVHVHHGLAPGGDTDE